LDAKGATWGKNLGVNDLSGVVQVVDRFDGSVPVCEIRGELDASNVDQVLDRVVGSFTHEAPGLVLDLARTSYLDSAGVRILFELARRLRSRRQELRIAVPDTGIVRRVLVLTALGDVVALDEDVAHSVSALQARI
jgi:anti-anti-sigma factor